MKETRSPEFKKKIALEAIREERSINEIAQAYEVHPVQVCKWKKELLEGAELIFERKRKKVSEEDKIGSLERKIGQLAIENDWLKKKLGL